MVHIEFREPNTASWKKWREVCRTEQKRHNNAVTSGMPSKVKPEIYKGQKIQVYMNSEGPFGGKCAYCEQKIYANQFGDIEHFRPHAEVKDEANKPLMVKIGGRLKKHPGYYWLAYAWDNLLPSCTICNRSSIHLSGGRLIGKRSLFPVKGFRAVRLGEETREQPLLVHPARENPAEHLKIDGLGVFHPKSDRGKTCIDIFGLNDRDLPNERKNKYDDIKLKMQLLARAMSYNPNGGEAKQLMNRLLKIRAGCDAYTAAARKAISDSLNNLKVLSILSESQ